MNLRTAKKYGGEKMNNLLRRMIAFMLLLAMLLPLGATRAEATEVSESTEVTEVAEVTEATEAPTEVTEVTEAAETEVLETTEEATEEAPDAAAEAKLGESGTLETPGVANPLYPERERDLSAAPRNSAEDAPQAAATYYSTVAAAGQALANQMENRVTSIPIGFKLSENSSYSIGEIYELIWEAAFTHTGVPTEGDYLRWQWDYRYGSSIYYSYSGGYYYLDFTYPVDYYTTAAQEKTVTSTVKTLLSELNLSGKSDYQKVKAIYDWMTYNIRYDYANLYNDYYTLKYTAYAGLINRTCVCQGYSLLFYRLCLEVGVDARCIPSIEEECHIWNIVKLGSYYYNLDATWDEGQSSYSWFLLNDANFYNHTRDAEYRTSSFYAKYPMSPTNYNPANVTVSVPAKPHKITNVVSGVHVYWKAVSGAEKYGLWRSENGVNGTYKWIANPTTAHYTDTSVTSGKTYHYKVTAVHPLTGEHTAKSEAISTVYVSTPDITARYNKAAGIKLEWNKITGATGYAIYRKSYSGTDAWVRVKTITSGSTLTWTDESVKNNNGTVYRYTVRALAGSNRTILSGCRNTGRTMVRLCSQVMTSAAKASSTSIKCAWTTSSKVTGYEVRFVVNGSVYKTVTIGNYATGVKTFTGLKTGRTYQIQVRTYKTVSGVGSFYSAWSEAKYITL